MPQMSSLFSVRHACRGCEQVRQFTEEALSCALHPSGHLLAVGFHDRLRLFAVLLDSLKYAVVVQHCQLTLCMHASSSICVIHARVSWHASLF